MKKGQKRPKDPIVFENDDYKITKIPLNYAINVKIMVEGTKRHPVMKLVPQTFYSDVDRGLEEAKELAEHRIAEARHQLTLQK